jgi:hypothetical protein
VKLHRINILPQILSISSNSTVCPKTLCPNLLSQRSRKLSPPTPFTKGPGRSRITQEPPNVWHASVQILTRRVPNSNPTSRTGSHISSFLLTVKTTQLSYESYCAPSGISLRFSKTWLKNTVTMHNSLGLKVII